MNSLFLAGVADAEIFKGNELFATAKTLIDSSITIGVSAEDIRAGKGAKLYGKYFHSSTFDLKLSDAMFRLEYLAANVGADLELGGDVFVEQYDVNKTFVLTETPVGFNGCSNIYLYWKRNGEDYYNTLDVTGSKIGDEITLPVDDSVKCCVKYLYTNNAARRVTINANFVPDTLSIYLTANLYSGDVANCESANTTKVGTLTIKVPRFLLSGSQEIAMSMTGAANTPLEGSALAIKGDGCDGDGIYAEIVELLYNNKDWHELVTNIIVDGGIDALREAHGDVSKLRIYATFSNGYKPKLLNNSDFTISVSDSSKSASYVDYNDTENTYSYTDNSIVLYNTKIPSLNYGEVSIESNDFNSGSEMSGDIRMGECLIESNTNHIISEPSFAEDVMKNIIFSFSDDIDTIVKFQNSQLSKISENIKNIYIIKNGLNYQSSLKNTKILENDVDLRNLNGLISQNFAEMEANNVLLPELGITELPDEIFKDAIANKIVVPNTIETINDNTFASENIRYILLNKSIDNAIAGTPWGATNATIIYMYPEGVEKVLYDYKNNILTIIGDGSLALTSDFVDVVYDYFQLDDKPHSVILEGVISIGDDAFSDCYELQSVTISNGVISIGNDAFSACDNLQSIDIPDSVTSIGNDAFNSCISLTSIIIPNGVPRIGNRTFESCHNLTNITIGESVTSIGNSAFKGCESLTSVTIPNTVESIGNNAFEGCESLTSITIPNGVTSIGDYVFNNCSSLTNITIPDNVESIGTGSFRECLSLTSIIIPDSVTIIGASTFSECYGLQSVTIGDSVISIGDSAFYDCSSLQSITIPNSLTNISVSTFGGCSSLTSIIIPDSVTSIGESAFDNCSSLQSITIPDSVTSIGAQAFYDCSNLEHVHMQGKTQAFVKSMANYSWYLQSGCYIHCSDGDITKKGRLPDEYQEVEWIGLGNGRIDTNFYGNQNTRVILNVSFSSSSTSENILQGDRIRIYSVRSTMPSLGGTIGFGGDKSVDNIAPNLRTGGKMEIELDKNHFKLSNTSETNEKSYTTTDFTCVSPIIIGNPTRDVSTKNVTVYSFQLYNNQNLARDFVPCYRKSDDTIGLYDLITNVFYINSGVGEFIKGDDI